MTLHDALGRKTGLLKVPIDVGSERPAAVRFSGPNLQEIIEAAMRVGAPIEIEAMSVKGPREMRIALKPGGVRHLLE